jgi:hypothetical protein
MLHPIYNPIRTFTITTADGNGLDGEEYIQLNDAREVAQGFADELNEAVNVVEEHGPFNTEVIETVYPK